MIDRDSATANTGVDRVSGIGAGRLRSILFGCEDSHERRVSFVASCRRHLLVLQQYVASCSSKIHVSEVYTV